jgi:hypothetical protein
VEVSVDGRRVGRTPLRLESLLPGDHLIEVTWPDGLRQSSVERVKAGESRVVSLRPPEEPPEPAPPPAGAQPQPEQQEHWPPLPPPIQAPSEQGDARPQQPSKSGPSSSKPTPSSSKPTSSSKPAPSTSSSMKSAMSGPAPAPPAALPLPPPDEARWPVELVRRPLTLPRGGWEIRSGLDVNLSDGAVGSPTAILLGLRYGVLDRLTLQIGLPPLAPPVQPPALLYTGLCLNPDPNGNGDCPGSTLAFSVGGSYAVVARDAFQVTVDLDFLFPDLNPLFAALSVGGQLAWRPTSWLQLWIYPRFAFALDKRAAGLHDFFALVVQPRFQVLPRLALYATAELSLDLEDRSQDQYPLGVGALYTPWRGRLDVGADLTLVNPFEEIGAATSGALSRPAGSLRFLRVFAILRL